MRQNFFHKLQNLPKCRNFSYKLQTSNLMAKIVNFFHKLQISNLMAKRVNFAYRLETSNLTMILPLSCKIHQCLQNSPMCRNFVHDKKKWIFSMSRKPQISWQKKWIPPMRRNFANGSEKIHLSSLIDFFFFFLRMELANSDLIAWHNFTQELLLKYNYTGGKSDQPNFNNSFVLVEFPRPRPLAPSSIAPALFPLSLSLYLPFPLFPVPRASSHSPSLRPPYLSPP